MKYIEYMELALEPKGEIKIPEIHESQVLEFLEIVNSNDDIKAIYDQVERYTDFAKRVTFFSGYYKSSVLKELFYAAKMGRLYKGVPNELVYILLKAFKEFKGYPVNYVLCAIKKQLLKPYVGKRYVSTHGTFDFLDVVDNVFGSKVSVLTSANLKVSVGDGQFFEVYILADDRVAILPAILVNSLGFDDIKQIFLDPAYGLVLNGKLLRTMYGKVGITLDDFDLRGNV